MEHEVFISYSHKDMQITNALVNKLEDNGTSCWIAPRNISAGQLWANAIAGAIPKSKVFLLVFSANSNSSEQVLREVEIAVHNKLIVIPVRIEDIMPSGGMRYYLATTQWIDVKGSEIDSKLSAISSTVKNIIAELDKGQKPEDIKSPASIMQSAEKALPQKRLSKKAVISIVSAALVMVVGLTLFLLRDTIFGAQNQSEQNLSAEQTTAAQTPDPNMIVNIENEALKGAIISTLENMGETLYGDLTVADMQKLETFRVVSTSKANWYKDKFPISVVNDILSSSIVVDDKIDNLSGLQYATNLKQLMVAGKEIIDLSPIKNLTNLINLDLPANYISDLSPLENLTNVITLDVSYNNITDIEPLKNMGELELLLLNDNRITDISTLADLPSLTMITIGENYISDISPLSDLENLSNISIYANPIKSLEPIKDNNIQYLFIDRDIYVTNTEVINALQQNGTEILIEEAQETEDSGLYTPEDFDLEPDMKVYITNPALEEAVIYTLESIGEAPKDELTMEDIFKLEIIVISTPELVEYAKSIVEPVIGEKYVYETNGNIDDFAKLQYAKNLKTIAIAGLDISKDTSFAGVHNIENFILTGDSEKMDIEHFGILEMDFTNIRYIYVENSKMVHLGIEHSLDTLEELTIINSDMNGLDRLQGAASLTSLNISNNNVNYFNPNAFGTLTSLKTLRIDGNPVEDPSGIHTIENLERLILDTEIYNRHLDFMKDLESDGCEIEIVD